MARTWVLVAESSRARILGAEKAIGPLHDVQTFDHPESRMHEHDLTSDLPGRTHDRMGDSRHAMGQKVGPKETQTDRFAKELADRLDAARQQGRYERLILAAPPKFLGLIRGHLTPSTAALVTEELQKNFVGESPEKIRSHLPDAI